MRGADLHWNGSAWVNCPINFENTSSVRDALGNSVYNFCDGFETGKGARAAFDVSGKTMAAVYAQVRAAGYTNLTIDDTTVLGSASFPAGSALLYQASTALTTAISYYPQGSATPPERATSWRSTARPSRPAVPRASRQPASAAIRPRPIPTARTARRSRA